MGCDRKNRTWYLSVIHIYIEPIDIVLFFDIARVAVLGSAQI